MSFADVGQELAYKVAVRLRAFSDGDVPLRENGKLSMELTDDLRALAIMALLSFGDNRLFFQNLARSGEVRETYLRRLRDAGIENDHHQASARFKPLLDAVAAGDFALANRIAALSPKEFRKGHEYVDDYCFTQIINGLIGKAGSKDRFLPYLNRFEIYLEGQSNARFDLSCALIDCDQVAFEEAFSELLNTHEQYITQAKQRGQLEDPVVLAHRFVCIEGLAILRIADTIGLKTESEYRYCPSIAMIPIPPFPRE